jgi:hypothetical protein
VRRIGAARASGAGARKGDLPGAGVGVAIVDTGIDLSHPDLDVASGVSFVEGHPSALDGQGHGTHCAGIVAARDDDVGVVGVAPGAKLYAVKVLDDDGSGSLSDVIAGLDWVTKNADRIAVANLSLGVRGQSPALRAAVQAAVHAGVVIVCAAGNDGADVFGEDGVFGTADDSIPAAFPEVCAVSAISDSDGAAGGLGGDLHGWKDDTFAAFSNYSAHPHAHPFVRSPGGAIDVAAPGVDIFSCWKDGAYRKASGTSMAAPHVTGLIARWIGQHGRDANHDGKIDEQDVYAIRQAIVDAAEPQAAWRPDGLTGDKDALHEGLAVVPGHAAAPPPNLTQRPAARPDVPRGTSPAAPDDVSRGTFPPGSIARRPASATPAAIVPAAASRRRFEPDPELGNIAGSIGVVAIIAPSAFVAEGERAGIVVGVRNHARDATSFDLVLLDADAGRGIGVKRVGALAGGDLTAVLFPVDPRTFDPRHELRAVALTPSGTSLGEMAFTPRR